MSESPTVAENRSWIPALALAASWAMIASALEFIVLVVAWYGFHRPMYQGLDTIWAKPLVNMLLFLPPALVLRLLPPRFFVGFLAFPAVAAMLLLILPGSPVPMIILAGGIGTQLGLRLSAPRRQAFTRRAGAALAVVFALAAIVTQAARLKRERAVVDGAAADAPNVLLIILDTVRAASLSLYGGRAGTPNIDSLGASGVVFDRAVSTAPWTLPSHASIFTGLWPHEHGADWVVPLDHRATTLAEVLGQRGYRTGGFVANLVFTSSEHGLSRGFQVYRDYRRSPGALLRSASLVQTITTSAILRRLTSIEEVLGRKHGKNVNEEFLDWESKAGGRPWFAFLNYYDAHEPYLPHQPYLGRYSSGVPARRFDKMRYWNVEGGISDWKALSPAEVEAERAAYEEAITGVDADVGALLAELRRRGVLDRTIVVLASDHGELFGEYGAHTHGNSIYWNTIHVPLVMSWPGHLPSGRRVREAVSLRDIGATVLGLAFPDAPSTFPGTPLPTTDDTARARELVLSELSLEEFTRMDRPMRNGALQSVTGFDWQYTRAGNGYEEVYWTVPGVRDSIVTAPGLRAAVIDSARARLAAARVPPPAVTLAR